MHALLAIWLTLSDAHALTQTQNGPIVEVAAGLGMGGTPFAPSLGGQLTVGWWTGTYDDAYSFGRYWALSQTTRADVLAASGRWSLAPMLEVRRGVDLFVVNTAGFLAGGPLVVSGEDEGEVAIGGTGRGGLALKLRRSRFWGLTLRVEGGVDVVAGDVSPAAAVLVGGGFARPARPLPKPEVSARQPTKKKKKKKKK
jgi:hypothetical protein